MPRSRDHCADPGRSSFDEMTGRHQKEALALQQKMLERLRRLDADDLKPAEVIRWFDVAVRVEKETMDARQGDEEGAKIREFIQCLLADPTACDLANQLVQVSITAKSCELPLGFGSAKFLGALVPIARLGAIRFDTLHAQALQFGRIVSSGQAKRRSRKTDLRCPLKEFSRCLDTAIGQISFSAR